MMNHLSWYAAICTLLLLQWIALIQGEPMGRGQLNGINVPLLSSVMESINTLDILFTAIQGSIWCNSWKTETNKILRLNLSSLTSVSGAIPSISMHHTLVYGSSNWSPWSSAVLHRCSSPLRNKVWVKITWVINDTTTYGVYFCMVPALIPGISHVINAWNNLHCVMGATHMITPLKLCKSGKSELMNNILRAQLCAILNLLVPMPLSFFFFILSFFFPPFSTRDPLTFWDIRIEHCHSHRP